MSDYQRRKLEEARRDGREWGRMTDYEPALLVYGWLVALVACIVAFGWTLAEVLL